MPVPFGTGIYGIFMCIWLTFVACLSCGLCEECTVICADCGEACENCADMCENCGLCADCTDICSDCGACSECADYCDLCELCFECAANAGAHCAECLECFTVVDPCEGDCGYCTECCECETEATLSGTITSFNDTTGNITLQLIPEGTSEPAYEVIVKGNTVDYSFANVELGTYTLKVSKANHVTREYTVVIGNSDMTYNVNLYLLGDANHDGKADSSDAVAILRNLAGYEVPVFYEDTADFNGDGKADSSDAVAILRKLAGY